MTETIIKRIIDIKGEKLIIFSPFCSVKNPSCQDFEFIFQYSEINYIKIKRIVLALFWYKVYFEILKDEFKILTGRYFFTDEKVRPVKILKIFQYSRNKLDIKLLYKLSKYIIIFWQKLYIKRIIWHQRREHW